jgi:hypothetical protein
LQCPFLDIGDVGRNGEAVKRHVVNAIGYYQEYATTQFHVTKEKYAKDLWLRYKAVSWTIAQVKW